MSRTRERDILLDEEEPKKKKKLNTPELENIGDIIKLGFNKEFKCKSLNLWRLKNIIPSLIRLDNMVGMENLKQTIFYQVLYYLQGLNVRSKGEYLHTAIYGAPGTGKTTVAYIIGDIYKKMGILSEQAVFKIARRDDLVAGYLGQTAIKTRKLLESCLGGILFIDEVYSMGSNRNEDDSFSKEAVDTLNEFLSTHKNNFCCIIAGYEKDVENCFFRINKGLKRRFQWVHKINPYTDEQLVNIFMKLIKDSNWNINIKPHILKDIVRDNKNIFEFAGGSLETFFTKVKMAHSKRVFNLEYNHKFNINIEDIKEGIKMSNNNQNIEKDKIPYELYS